ncbi:MAG TPA: hypothetical protein PKA88_13590 [Polyangiaceae bacterium]|nr:hypothetical protein [Polyangiaceae bacterium]
MTLADALESFAAGAARRAEPLRELVGWVDADLGVARLATLAECADVADVTPSVTRLLAAPVDAGWLRVVHVRGGVVWTGRVYMTPIAGAA